MVRFYPVAALIAALALNNWVFHPFGVFVLVVAGFIVAAGYRSSNPEDRRQARIVFYGYALLLLFISAISSIRF